MLTIEATYGDFRRERVMEQLPVILSPGSLYSLVFINSHRCKPGYFDESVVKPFAAAQYSKLFAH